MNYKFVAIFLVLLCCFMGAASAADDVSTDAVDASVGDAVAVDAVSDDTIAEEINEATIEKESEDVELTRGTPVNASNWGELKNKCENEDYDYDITLNGTSYIVYDRIVFGNSATITGTSDSYITGGTNTTTPFYSNVDSLTISFINVKFINMNVNNLLELGGTVTLENCTFTNINTALGHNSVVYNIQGTMNIVGCNFTNNQVGYGTVTNYNNQTLSDATMTVDNCRFINNSAEVEPGAINNCGNLEVTNSVFDNNYAKWWAGAIHTHNYANTTINNCNFTNNGAGWNGGALYTYSNLMVNNSRFINNSCKTTAGGGAIGSSSGWISTVNYNITIENCHFENNTNNASLTNQTPAQGNGGAISAMNRGILDVHGSTFVNNYAARGQAISAYGAGYIDPEGNITEGIPKVVIYNNTFRDHNRTTTTDTAYLTGNYSLDNNTFINCHQNNTGTNNIFINCTPESVNNADSSSTTLLKSKKFLLSSEMMGTDEYDVNIYINTSKDYDDSQDGLSWDTAIGGASSSISSIWDKFTSSDKVAIHIFGNVKRKRTYQMTCAQPITFIGYGENSSIDNLCMNYEMSDNCITWTFINLTIKNCDFSKNCNFINCRFESNVTFSKILASYDRRALVENGNDVARNFTLENSTFENYEGSSPIVTSYEFSNLILKNCTFNNIVSDSIFYHGADLQQDDGISLYDCKFTNCNLKGVVDFAGDIEINTYVAIENCDYDFDATTNVIASEDGAHNYVNATKLAKPDTTLVADIDDAGNLLVNLTAGDSAVANGKVLISVNGAEAVSYDLGEDGTLSIALSDLTDATGKLDIAVTFEETDDYKGSTGSASAVLVVKTVTEKIDPVATSITASDITATAKIAKTLSITLKDASGNALANKAVKVTVNGKTSTVTTDKNGVAKVTVNYAKAGTYYYSLSFLGDNDYKASLKPVKVTVNKQATKATFAKKTFKVKATKKINFTLKDSKGKAIAKKKITFKVNGKTYTAKTNSKGVATVKIVIKKKGKYTATAKFAGDTTYKAISKKATITIK